MEIAGKRYGKAALSVALPGNLRHGGAEILVGIDRHVLDADLVVQDGAR